MPRPTPDRLVWAASERWPEAGAFWDEPVAAEELADLELKYSTLLRLIEAPQGRGRDAGLRELAARWPGVLREGQLVSRAGLEARRQSLGIAPGSPRAAWRGAEIAAVPLWSELHRLLADVALIRAGALRPADLPHGLGPEAARRWPLVQTWWMSMPWPVDARVTRSWLAAVADLAPDVLDRLLRT